MSLNDEQPTSRRAARMVERERAAHETQLESTAERAQSAGPVVSNAIFDGASWAQPEEIRSWAPVDPAPVNDPAPATESAPAAEAAPPAAAAPPATPETLSIVRRRDLRSRPADAPPVNLTGEIVIDPSKLVPAEAPVASPPADSIFAAPQLGAPPSWSNAAAPTSAAVDAVNDAPGEHTSSRRARRAMAAPEAAATEGAAPAAAAPEVIASEVAAPALIAPEVAAPAPAAPEPSAPELFAPEPIENTATSTMPPRSSPSDTGSGWLAPDGHWSRQLADSDVDEPFESTFSRQVGSTPPTTNALVIPAAQPLDLSGPLTATGEIMLTGSIKLPDAYARTGATDLVDLNDRDDLDDLFEDSSPLDRPADSQPIRAAAAVSGEHVLGSPIVSTVKPGRGNRVLTGLLITASALAVVVTGLIIAAFAFGVV